MDLVRLNPEDYYPIDLVEGYSSLIWTERFQDAGDFQLNTPNIRATRSALPLNSLVSLRDTAEVMIVETHDIAENDDGSVELVVGGRSLETFLEQRAADVAWNATGVSYFTGSVNAAEGIVTVINNQIVDGYLSSHDEIGADEGPIVAVDRTTVSDSAENYKIEHVDLYTQVQAMLRRSNFGIRTSRLATPGTVELQIHNGIDRTDEVVFHLDVGEINNAKYLFSKKNYKNIAYVFSKAGSQIVVPVGGSGAISGLLRRVLYVNATDIEDVDSGTTLTELLTHRGRAELKKFNKQFFFDGEVSPLSSQKYKRDYSLGDEVTLSADYGVNDAMLVTEYIRTEDQEGERGYPTLVHTSVGS